MNDLETLQRIVAHAEAWRLDDAGVEAVRLSGEPVVRVRDDDVAGFASWANHLAQQRLQVERGVSRVVITVSGLLLCSKPVSVVVDVAARFVPAAADSEGLSIEDFVAVVATRQRALGFAKAGA